MLKRNLIANFIGQGWAIIMGLAFIPLYIKYLGIEAYGLIGMFGVLQACLSLLDMGMTPTLGREMARYTGGSHSTESIRDLLRSIEMIVVGLAALIFVGVALGANWIATHWVNAESLSIELVAQAFVIMGLVTALRFVEGIYRSAIIGLQRQVLFNVVNSIMATLRGLGAVGILGWVSPTIEAFFLWQGLVSIATLTILAVTTYQCLSSGDRNGRFSIAALRSVWVFTRGMVGISFLTIVLTQLDKILLSKLLPLNDFGFYMLAAMIAGSVTILVAPITQAFYPKFCEQYARGDKAALSISFHKGAQLVTVIAGSAAIVLILLAEIFLRLWTQDDELTARVSILLRLLTAGYLLNALMWVPYQMQLAHGWTALTVKVNVVTVALVVPGLMWAAPRYGAVGAAWVWLALNAGYFFIAAHFMFRRILIEDKRLWYWQDVIIPLLTSACALSVIKKMWVKPDNLLIEASIFLLASFVAIVISALSAPLIRQEILFKWNKIWNKRHI
jgi:O-antigen/teichoic acid export membrane protein